MAQKFVMKNRSKDSDGKKEMSHMIRDPRQRTLSRHSGPQSHDLYNRHYVGLGSSKQGKMVALGDKGVSSRIRRKASIAAREALKSEKKPSKSSCKALTVRNQSS